MTLLQQIQRFATVLPLFTVLSIQKHLLEKKLFYSSRPNKSIHPYPYLSIHLHSLLPVYNMKTGF